MELIIFPAHRVREGRDDLVAPNSRRVANKKGIALSRQSAKSASVGCPSSPRRASITAAFWPLLSARENRQPDLFVICSHGCAGPPVATRGLRYRLLPVGIRSELSVRPDLRASARHVRLSDAPRTVLCGDSGNSSSTALDRCRGVNLVLGTQQDSSIVGVESEIESYTSCKQDDAKSPRMAS